MGTTQTLETQCKLTLTNGRAGIEATSEAFTITLYPPAEEK